VASLLGVVNAQQRPFFTDVPFANDTSGQHRQDFCDKNRAYANGTLELRNALKGMALHPLIYVDQYFPLLYPEGAEWGVYEGDLQARIDPDNPGLMTTILDILTDRAGFTWRDTYAVVTNIPDDKTWGEHLMYGVEHYDAYASFWTVTVDRLKMGIDFPEGWLEDYLILISSQDNDKEEQKQEPQFRNWLEPFSWEVWLLILATGAMSGMLFHAFEILADPVKRNQGCTREMINEDVILSSIICTQFTEFRSCVPHSASSKILLGSVWIWSLLLSATYTANLASTYVVESVQTATFNSINDVIEAGFDVCVWKGTFDDVSTCHHMSCCFVLIVMDAIHIRFSPS